MPFNAQPADREEKDADQIGEHSEKIIRRLPRRHVSKSRFFCVRRIFFLLLDRSREH